MTEAEKARLSQECSISALQLQLDEASGFYKSAIWVASGFLGATLLFIEKISSHPTCFSLVLLFAGWASLILAIIVVLLVRRKNVDLLNKIREKGCDELVKPLNNDGVTSSGMALTFLVIGMTCIMLFGAINIGAVQSEKNREEKSKKVQKKVFYFDIQSSVMTRSSPPSPVAVATSL